MITKMPSKLAVGLTAALLVVGVAGLPAVTTAQQGAAQRAGEALDNAGRNIRRGVERAFARTRASVHEQELITRVYSRIHWDKMLVGSALELEVRDDAVVFLRGTVPDAEAKKRAVVLARDTVGVNQVVDELAVAPPAKVVPAPLPAAKSPGTPSADKP
jgi:hyperosmotically inducible protein